MTNKRGSSGLLPVGPDVLGEGQKWTWTSCEFLFEGNQRPLHGNMPMATGSHCDDNYDV